MSNEFPSGIEALVCQEIARRQAKGFAKYGTTVAENPLELKAWLTHAMEEALDQAIYLRRAIDAIEQAERSEYEDTIRVAFGGTA